MSRRRDRTARTGGVRGSVKAAPKPIDSRRGAPLNISGAGTARGSSGGRLSPRSAAAGEAHAALSAAAATGHAHLVGRGVRTWWLTGRCHRRPPLRARCSELGLSMTSMSLAGYERCYVHVCLCLCVGVPGDLRVHVGVAVCMCVWGTQPTSCCMQVLGRGNFGAVHLGVDKNTGEQVAIKVIRKPERATHRDEQVILNEIAILKKVRAPLLSKHQPGALSSHLSTAIYRLSQSWIART